MGCKEAPKAAPSQISGSQRDLSNPLVASTGIYPDGWMEPEASFTLTETAGNTALHIRGSVPLTEDSGYRTTVEVRLDGAPLARRGLGLGKFDFSVPVPDGAATHKITLAFDRTETLPGADGRKIGGHLDGIGFEKSIPAKLKAAPDIAQGAELKLGTGWGPLETFGGETFRWVENEAAIELQMGAAKDAVLSILGETGPGAAGKSILLRVMDGTGRQVGAAVLDGRRTSHLVLPLSGKGGDTFKLQLEGGGKHVGSDPRALNFRVFEMDAAGWK